MKTGILARGIASHTPKGAVAQPSLPSMQQTVQLSSRSLSISAPQILHIPKEQTAPVQKLAVAALSCC